MATRFGIVSNLTLVCRQRQFLEQIQRGISTSVSLSAGSWTVQSKSKREKVLYQAPPKDETERSDIKEIQIPEKISRSPTAILEVLAATVRNDVNQPRYMILDDPHLYATTDRAKKRHMASYESGRRTAEHMLEMYPDYFTPVWDDPLPSGWQKETAYKYTEPSEEALSERIDKRKVQHAIDIYRQAKSNGITLSQEIQERLLEFLVVFNCEELKAPSDVETYINAPDYNQFSPFPPNTWNKNNAAEEVFNSLHEQTAAAYCTMARGMARNYNKEGAMNMYGTMKARNMPVDIDTYSAILRTASLDSDTIDNVKICIEGIFRDMAASGVEPTEDTFASAITNLRRLSRWTGSKHLVLSLLSEMKACGIRPGLATYVEVLHVFYYFKDKSPKTPELFEQILDDLEGREFDCTSESDIQFFRGAMGMIVAHFPDPKLALRVHKILQHGKNRNLLSNRQSQYGYYTDLFTVIAPLEPIDSVMQLYHDVVPFIYSPPVQIYSLLLESIQMNRSYHYLPDLFADLQWSTILKDFDFLKLFTTILAAEKHEPKLQQDLTAVVSSLVSLWAARRHLMDGFPINGLIIGDLITVHLNNSDLKSAWSLFETYRNDRRMRGADPSENALSLLADHTITAQDYSSTKEVLTVMSILDYNVSDQVERSLQTLSLSENERSHLQSLSSGSSSSSSSSDSDSD